MTSRRHRKRERYRQNGQAEATARGAIRARWATAVPGDFRLVRSAMRHGWGPGEKQAAEIVNGIFAGMDSTAESIVRVGTLLIDIDRHNLRQDAKWAKAEAAERKRRAALAVFTLPAEVVDPEYAAYLAAQNARPATESPDHKPRPP